MPTEEIYEKYEQKQTKDSKELYWEHPSHEDINDMIKASHKPITSYDKLPQHIKDKPGVWSYEPNVEMIEHIGETQRPGDRRYGQQESSFYTNDTSAGLRIGKLEKEQE